MSRPPPGAIRSDGVRVPQGWHLVDAEDESRGYVSCRRQGLRVIVSVSRPPRGPAWLHLSAAFANPRRFRAGAVPTASDVALVKRAWIGAGRWAFQTWPPDGVEIAPGVVHLIAMM